MLTLEFYAYSMFKQGQAQQKTGNFWGGDGGSYQPHRTSVITTQSNRMQVEVIRAGHTIKSDENRTKAIHLRYLYSGTIIKIPFLD